MAKKVTGKRLLSHHVTSDDRILLINPPVEDTRYAWLRWNQPLDLLKLGAFLRKEIGCTVDLLDFMKPDAKGKVTKQRLPGARQNRTVGEGEYFERYPMWRFGRDYETIAKWVVEQRVRGEPPPTQVWIGSLCSYWYQGVAQVSMLVRQHLRDATIVLLGNYPFLMPEHASEYCVANLLLSKPFDLTETPADLSLYGDDPPPFVAVEPVVDVAVSEIRAAVERGVTDVTFFTENVCRDGGDALAKIVRSTANLHRHLKFHVICGLDPQLVTPKIARTLAHDRIAALHFEESTDKGHFRSESYERAIRYLREAGADAPFRGLSGFVWVGRPEEEIEDIVQRMCHVLRFTGTFILKPFTPTPRSPEQKRYPEYLDRIESHEEWSPHFFPFAELNEITRADYNDLYRLAAFLNDKVRGRSFDFLEGTMGLDFLRESLRRESWTIEPQPLRIAD